MALIEPKLVTFLFNDNRFQCYGYPCFYRPEDILEIVGVPKDGIRSLKHKFVDGIRQRSALLGKSNNFYFCVTDYDSFEIIYGEKENPRNRTAVDLEINRKYADIHYMPGMVEYELLIRGFDIPNPGSREEALKILDFLIEAAESDRVIDHY